LLKFFPKVNHEHNTTQTPLLWPRIAVFPCVWVDQGTAWSVISSAGSFFLLLMMGTVFYGLKNYQVPPLNFSLR
jgi:hypothetical protein